MGRRVRHLHRGSLTFLLWSVGTTAFLPEDRRFEWALRVLPFAAKASDVDIAAPSPWFVWGGWGLAVVVAAVGGVVIRRQHARLQSQGDELRAFRDANDPERASSRALGPG